MTVTAPLFASIRVWQATAIVSVLPGVAHLLVLSMALLGVTPPAVWISQHLLDGVWAVPLLWAFVIGGPLFSVIAGLVLELWPGRARSFGRLFGMCSWVMLILGLVATLPLPWVLVFE